MELLKGIGALIGLILYILTWRIKTEEKKREEAKKLEEEADEAIRTGDLSKLIDIWDRVR